MKTAHRRRVLLIDDDVAFLRMMGIAFAQAGYEVDTAQDGAQGVEQFRAEPADLAVVDMLMPVRDGVETLIALRALHPGVRIIAISGASGRSTPCRSPRPWGRTARWASRSRSGILSR
jgi:DNA-binding response OmpR family regulator